MCYLIYFTVVATISLTSACGGEAPQQRADNPEPGSEISDTSLKAEPSAPPPNTIRSSHECEVSGKILEGNQTWINEKELLISIVADESTADPDFGDGHRILLVTDTKTCEEVSREVLPVSGSPDFPYYIAEIVYNNTSQLVGIRGADVIYCYDVNDRKLLPPLSPAFLTGRLVDDAQSGMIQRLEVWENYLIGYALDMGTFVFDFSDKRAPKPLLPYAEFKTRSGEYNSLFMVPAGDGRGLQGIIPQYDYDADAFKVNPLFEEARDLNTNLPKSARNNRFLVMRERGEGRLAVGIDLQECKEVRLPEDVASKKVQDVLEWMRSNN